LHSILCGLAVLTVAASAAAQTITIELDGDRQSDPGYRRYVFDGRDPGAVRNAWRSPISIYQS
jgi:hypothetical protein